MLCSVNLERKPSVLSSRRMKSERISARKCSGSVDKQESITHAKGNDVKSVYMSFSSRLDPYTESIPEGWRDKEEESRSGMFCKFGLASSGSD